MTLGTGSLFRVDSQSLTVTRKIHGQILAALARPQQSKHLSDSLVSSLVSGLGCPTPAILNAILIIPHRVADSLRQEREQTGPWMTYIISRHKVRPAPGTFRVYEGRFTNEKSSTFQTLLPFFCCLFCVTVETRCVNLPFMRRKPIRSRGLMSKLTDEHVLEAAAGGCVQSFCQSEQIHPGLPSPQPTDPTLGSRFPLSTFTQQVCRLSLFFLLSSSLTHQSTGQFPQSGSLIVK